MTGRDVAILSVLAGVNGSGKSSVVGAYIVDAGRGVFNPDVVARVARDDDPGLSASEAARLAVRAWRDGFDRALREGACFSFETTLSGAGMRVALERAAGKGARVEVVYVGLASVELNIQRVASRAAAGGHDIPEADIRRRYGRSPENLRRLLPHLSIVRVLDNSEDNDPKQGRVPMPRLLLDVRDGVIVHATDVAEVPDWAQAVVLEATRIWSTAS